VNMSRSIICAACLPGHGSQAMSVLDAHCPGMPILPQPNTLLCLFHLIATVERRRCYDFRNAET
jgi:hypothetical protein